MRILTTLLSPDGGRALVCGNDIVKDAARYASSSGCRTVAPPGRQLTGLENLQLIGRLTGQSRNDAKSRVRERLRRVPAGRLRGQGGEDLFRRDARRLDLAASLVARPRVIFLDEPTTGLDPRSRNEVWDIVRNLSADGMTVLLTTQYLEEADRARRRIVVVDHGAVIATGTSEDLKGKVGGDVVEFTVPDRRRVPDAVAAIASIGESEPHADLETGVVNIGVGGRGSDALIDAVRALDGADVETRGLALRRPSLDDVFLALTGHAAEDEPSGRDAGGAAARASRTRRGTSHDRDR